MSRPELVAKKRKPKARHTAVILGSLEERLNCIVMDEQNESHVNRCHELLDELKRSMSGQKEEEAE